MHQTLRMVLVSLLTLLFVSGCLAVSDTVREIRTDPESFHAEAATTAHTVSASGAELPQVAYIVIGYGIAFLRRMYVNWRKQVWEKKALLINK